MYILGLTGSIGMGKSTTAAMFRAAKIPVHDADATVHRLMAPTGKAFPAIADAFPAALVSGHIDRQALGAKVFHDTKALKTLESILHPLVRREETAFLRQCRAQGRNMVVLDIPLLFETAGQARCNGVAVVTASAFLQKQRVLGRDNMTAEKFHAILAKQMPDFEKRLRADFIIQSGLGLGVARRQVKAIIRDITHHA